LQKQHTLNACKLTKPTNKQTVQNIKLTIEVSFMSAVNLKEILMCT